MKKPSELKIHMRHFEDGASEQSQDIRDDAALTDLVKQCEAVL